MAPLLNYEGAANSVVRVLLLQNKFSKLLYSNST